MKKIDIFLAAICGLSVAWIASDFLKQYFWIFLIILPILSVVGFWLTELASRKFLFLHQVGKFSLAGAFADVADIKIFQLLYFFAPFSLTFKVVSFLAATGVKYVSDKYWTFGNHETKNMHIEAIKFFTVAILGSAINVTAFYFISKIQTGLPFKTWQEASIILAALATAAWNFCGYKFVVFKK